MKNFFISGFLILVASSLLAQEPALITDSIFQQGDTSWKRGGYASLQFNQVAFSHWAAGGENSLSLYGIGLGFANYLKGKKYWNSYGMFNYGFINTQYDRIVRKNTDLIELQTKAGHELKKKIYLAGLINFRSQFGNGYIYPNDSLVVSKFMAPGYLIISAGIEWKPVDYFSLYVSPATGKFTFVTDPDIANIVINGASLWGTEPAVYDSLGNLITPGEKVRSEFGAYVAAAFLKDVMKNVNVASKIQLFANYTDKVKSNRDNIDVIYDLFINMQVNRFLTTTFFLNIIYDHNIVIADVDDDGIPTGTAGPRTQLKEGFGIGLAYKFGDELK